MEVLAQFYGNEAAVVHDGLTFSSPPLTDKDEIAVEWHLFKQALIQESRLVREEMTAKATVRVEASGAYTGIFPEMFKLLKHHSCSSCRNSFS